MSRCWSMLNNHWGRDSRPAASHGHVPNPTGPDVDTPSGGGEVPESARSRTDRPGKQRWGERGAKSHTQHETPGTHTTEENDEDNRPQEWRRATTNPGSASGGGGAPRTQFLSELSRSDFNTGTYICEDSQTTASWSATTGGCPPMLKLFMIGNQNQIKIDQAFPWERVLYCYFSAPGVLCHFENFTPERAWCALYIS